MMSSSPASLEPSYAARAIPAGSARYWSHFFAARDVQPALLGIYALQAEWQALIDPATEQAVAQLKLGWWQEEIQRLAQGRGAHPISTYLASLPHAAGADFAALQATLAAAIDESSGVPIERAEALAAHAGALWGEPLSVASRLGAASLTREAPKAAIDAFAQAEYLTLALAGYRRAAALGRIVFPVDELLTFGVENSDLIADAAPLKLERYLKQLKQRAHERYRAVESLLPGTVHAAQRHLLVLAALGRRQLEKTSPAKATGFRDMLCAWRTARRAQS